MTDGCLIRQFVCEKTSVSIFLEQFLTVLNLKYLRRILLSKNGRLIAMRQSPIPVFCAIAT